MNRDLPIVLFSGVVAIANPTLLAATTMMLLLPNPKRLMLGYPLGAYATSAVAGLVIVSSLYRSRAVNTSTHLLSPAGEIVVGALALVMALRLARGAPRTAQELA